MKPDQNRKEGLLRLTLDRVSPTNQHYIHLYFLVNDIKKAVTSYAKGDVLDIGCGNKPYLSFFKTGISKYVGCDIIQSSENVVDFICPANKLCFDDASFDTVFSTQTMEHVSDHQGMVKESFRVLKPGGHAIFTVPFSWELHEEPYDFFRFTKYGLKDLFEKNGFEIVEIKPNGGKWAAVFQLWINVLFSTRKYVTIRSRIIKLLFVRLKLIVPYNKFAIWLDKRYFDEGFTLNYIVITKKKLNTTLS